MYPHMPFFQSFSTVSPNTKNVPILNYCVRVSAPWRVGIIGIPCPAFRKMNNRCGATIPVGRIAIRAVDIEHSPLRT